MCWPALMVPATWKGMSEPCLLGRYPVTNKPASSNWFVAQLGGAVWWKTRQENGSTCKWRSTVRHCSMQTSHITKTRAGHYAVLGLQTLGFEMMQCANVRDATQDWISLSSNVNTGTTRYSWISQTRFGRKFTYFCCYLLCAPCAAGGVIVFNFEFLSLSLSSLH